MLLLPPHTHADDITLYAGADGSEYVDRPPQLVASSLARGEAGALLTAEVAFAGVGIVPGAAASAAAPPPRRLPVPWRPGPVFVWTGDAPRHALARAMTSGVGRQLCVFSATLADPAARIEVAAELNTPARLGPAAAVRGGGTLDLTGAPPAGAGATLGEWLVDRLTAGLDRGDLRLTLTEPHLMGPVLLHWARAAADDLFEGTSLAAPRWKPPTRHRLALDVAWTPGATIALRAIRRLSFTAGDVPTVDHAPFDPAAAVLPAERVWRVHAAGAWRDYHFVTVTAPGLGAPLTLSAERPRALLRLAGLDPATVTAVGHSRLHADPMPLPVCAGDGDVLTVRLAPLCRVRLLVGAARRLLVETGPLAVRLDHPALVRAVTDGPLRLDPASGELKRVSAVFSAIMRADELAAPYTVAVTTADGLTLRWTARPDDHDMLDLAPAHLPRLRAIAATATVVEARQGATSLGRRDLAAGDAGCWVYDPTDGPLALRALAGDYAGPWLPASGDVITAPQLERRRVTIVAPPEARLSLEIRAASGTGPPVAATVGLGDTVAFWQPAGESVYEYRAAANRPTGPWRTGNDAVLRLP